MPSGAVQAMREVQEAVRRHLLQSPQAADTLVGIRQWWLPEVLQSMSMELIGLALTEMIAAGEVRCDTLPDGTRLYSLAERLKPPDGGGMAS